MLTLSQRLWHLTLAARLLETSVDDCVFNKDLLGAEKGKVLRSGHYHDKGLHVYYSI